VSLCVGRVPGSLYLVSGAWYQAPGIRYVVPGPAKYQAPDTWVPGTWYQVPGARPIQHTEIPDNPDLGLRTVRQICVKFETLEERSGTRLEPVWKLAVGYESENVSRTLNI